MEDPMSAPLRAEVAEFFARFEGAGLAQDWPAFDAMFLDSFLNLDPQLAVPIPRSALIAALPRRDEMFGSIGARGMALTEATETPLDDLHTLVRTTWTVEFEEPRADRPLTMSSSFLLRREPDGWRIAVYLNHQDVAAVIAAEQAARESGD
jgi:hypothetical protein